ncbi:MAG: methyltransferase family protein [Desulfomonilaceae bacterium]
MSSEISTPRLLVQSLVGFGGFCALIFGGAGTIAWTEAWLFILIQSSASTIMVLWLKKHNPELLQERMDLWKRVVKSWDKAIVILLIAASVPFFVLPGLDAIRYRWSYVPLPLKVIGFVGIVLSYGLIFWVLKTNPYSSAAVEIQEDRGHTTITTGPYQYVRHPMYVGAILLIFSIPLALGSLVTFISGVILTALIVARTHLEDKTLHQELNGYTAYAETVKYRVIPGIW